MRAFLLLLVVLTTSVAAESSGRGLLLKRKNDQSCVALVVGNAAYPDQPLVNPGNDAKDVSVALQTLGFTVTTVLNADRAAFHASIEAFGKQIVGTQAAAFYYAGHGLQVNGENYLLPVGEALNNEAEVPFKAINIGLVLAQMETAKCPINLVVLDACRNNPLARSGRSTVKGLAQVHGPAGSLIVYSTAPGQVAGDGQGANGIFTAAFLKHVSTPGQDIDLFLRVVSGEVQQVTSGKQVPWRSSNLTQGFCFVPALSADELEFERKTRVDRLGVLEAQQVEMERQRKSEEALMLAKQAEIAAADQRIKDIQTKMPKTSKGADKTFLEITTAQGVIRCRLFADACPVTVQNVCELAEGKRAFTDPATGQQVTRPFYDGLTFHRVVPGFMIQGGDPKGDGTGGPGFQFKDEINAVSLGLDKEAALQGDNLHPQCAYMGNQFVQLYISPKLAGRGIGPASTAEERNAAIGQILPGLQTLTLMQFYRDLGYKYDDKLPPSRKPVRGVLAMANSGANTNGSQFFINLGDTPHLTGKHTVFGEVVAGMEVATAIGAVPRGERDRPTTPVVMTSVKVIRE